jgi:hypothetical protein
MSFLSCSSLCLTAIDASIDFAALCSKSVVWLMGLPDYHVNQYNPRRFQHFSGCLWWIAGLGGACPLSKFLALALRVCAFGVIGRRESGKRETSYPHPRKLVAEQKF